MGEHEEGITKVKEPNKDLIFEEWYEEKNHGFRYGQWTTKHIAYAAYLKGLEDH